MTATVSEAVAAAEAAAASSGVQIRELTSLAEMEACRGLYDSIWHPDPNAVPVSLEMMRALSKTGNYVVGAYDGDLLVGACLGFFAEPASRSMHSHIAGVSPGAQGRDIGFALKLHQRAWAVGRGLATITWTFDPLVRRNAYFNVGKLGAVPTAYLPNFYGGMQDRINFGDDTDRVLVEWPLASDSVAAACAGRSPRVSIADLPGAAIALDRDPAGAPRPGQAAGAHTILLAVPDDVERLRAGDPALARAWREAIAATLGGLLAEGATVTGFDRTGWYVMAR